MYFLEKGGCANWVCSWCLVFLVQQTDDSSVVEVGGQRDSEGT